VGAGVEAGVGAGSGAEELPPPPLQATITKALNTIRNFFTEYKIMFCHKT
jgi:hypothetical protein